LHFPFRPACCAATLNRFPQPGQSTDMVAALSDMLFPLKSTQANSWKIFPRPNPASKEKPAG
jgi:hypothetical protein